MEYLFSTVVLGMLAVGAVVIFTALRGIAENPRSREVKKYASLEGVIREHRMMKFQLEELESRVAILEQRIEN